MRLRFALALCLVVAPAALANTITVTALGDVLANDGVCTRREAILNANNNAATWPDCAAGSGADVINLPAGTITMAITIWSTSATARRLATRRCAARTAAVLGSLCPRQLMPGRCRAARSPAV